EGAEPEGIGRGTGGGHGLRLTITPGVTPMTIIAHGVAGSAVAAPQTHQASRSRARSFSERTEPYGSLGSVSKSASAHRTSCRLPAGSAQSGPTQRTTARW